MVDVDAVTRSFSGRRVLDGVSLQVAPGERLVLRGPNGSGKTTLLRCILGTLTPDSGSIRVAGVAAGTLEARRRVGVSLAQERAFYLRLTGRENLGFYASLRGAESVERILDELQLRELAATRVDRYSSGQLQQLAFARALLGEPQVLLLDEPTRSLDDEAQARFWQALEARPHTAVVLASHAHQDVQHATGVYELGTRR